MKRNPSAYAILIGLDGDLTWAAVEPTFEGAKENVDARAENDEDAVTYFIVPVLYERRGGIA